MDIQELATIAQTYATPTYILDEQAFKQRLEHVKKIMGTSIDLCYSIKANPFLSKAAQACGFQLEVCSPGELEICKRLHVDPKAIVYSGVCKQTDDIQAALRYGVGVCTAESVLQALLIEHEAAKLDKQGLLSKSPVRVLLRLNAGSQFGMCQDDLEHLINNRAQFMHCSFVGIHYFVGTQRKKLTHQEKELARLEALIDELERTYNWKCQRLEYGPGLAYPYFIDQDASDTLLPAKELAPALQRIANRVPLTVEMGRFFASECGTYLTRIVDIKHGQDTKTNYAFIDGGINHVSYLGQMMGLKCPSIINVSQQLATCLDASTCEDEAKSKSALSTHAQSTPEEPQPFVQADESKGGRFTSSWTLCGSLCTTSDVLVREYESSLGLNDILAFQHIGAYSITEAMYLFLSRDMPRIVIRKAHGVYELARDFIPTNVYNCPQNADK